MVMQYTLGVLLSALLLFILALVIGLAVFGAGLLMYCAWHASGKIEQALRGIEDPMTPTERDAWNELYEE
jgi:hypothetical protein